MLLTNCNGLDVYTNMDVCLYIRKSRRQSAFNNKRSASISQSKRKNEAISTTSVSCYKRKDQGVKMINQYQVDRILGQGSFAKVYLCTDTQRGVQYAIK